MKSKSIFIGVLALALGFSGCGGGGASGLASGSAGKATVKIAWPAPTRLIPNRTQIIKVTITQDTLSFTQFATRPAGDSSTNPTTSTLTFNNLVSGQWIVSATAYENLTTKVKTGANSKDQTLNSTHGMATSDTLHFDTEGGDHVITSLGTDDSSVSFGAALSTTTGETVEDITSTTTVPTGANSTSQTLASVAGLNVGDTLHFYTALTNAHIVSIDSGTNTVTLDAAVNSADGETVGVVKDLALATTPSGSNAPSFNVVAGQTSSFTATMLSTITKYQVKAVVAAPSATSNQTLSVNGTGSAVTVNNGSTITITGYPTDGSSNAVLVATSSGNEMLLSTTGPISLSSTSTGDPTTTLDSVTSTTVTATGTGSATLTFIYRESGATFTVPITVQ